MPVVGSLTVSPEDAIRVIQILKDDNLYFLRSRLEQVELGRGREALLVDGLWDVGRVFSKEYEIRWRLDGELYRINALTEKQDLPTMTDGIAYEKMDDEWDLGDSKTILWGAYKDYGDGGQGFLQVRVPRFLEYPYPGDRKWEENEEAVILGVKYLKGGAILFFTTLTRVLFPMTWSPSLIAPIRRISRRTVE